MREQLQGARAEAAGLQQLLSDSVPRGELAASRAAVQREREEVAVLQVVERERVEGLGLGWRGEERGEWKGIEGRAEREGVGRKG